MTARKGSKPSLSIKHLIKPDGWMERGICRIEGASVDVFIGGSTRKAREYCGRCPVRRECLDYGLRTNSVGIFGGELLELVNRDTVTLTPLALFSHKRPLENLENPPELKDHQRIIDIF